MIGFRERSRFMNYLIKKYRLESEGYAQFQSVDFLPARDVGGYRLRLAAKTILGVASGSNLGE